MSQVIREITIDVAQTNNLRAITAKQNDLNSRFLQINITNSGNVIRVSPDRIVTMNVKRTDGEAKPFYGSVNEDGSVTVPLTTWMLAIPGSINCDVSIINPEDNTKLTTMQFSIYVEAAVFPQSELEESEEYDVLVSLLGAAEKAEDCVEATKEAQEAADMAKDASKGVVTIEQNTDSPLKFWVGTKAEYDALENKDSSCFYILSDDHALDEIYGKINALANEVRNYHTPYDITEAIVSTSSSETRSLVKCGKTCMLTYILKGPFNYSKSDTVFTITGYAPVKPYQVLAYADRVESSGQLYHYSAGFVLEADASGQNTLVKTMDTLEDTGSSDSVFISATFICK